jgi:polysaccharide biosynthesis protein PslG
MTDTIVPSLLSSHGRPLVLRAVLLAALAAVLATSALAALASPAHAKVTVGIGQQTPDLFAAPLWRALHAPAAKYVTPWDTLSDPVQRARLDAWMASSRAAGARPLIAFRSSMRSARLARRLPTDKQFRRAFRALHKRYPRVRDWVPWNETNHPTALTGNKPGRAAAYFNIVTRNCRRCNVVAGDVLDIGNMGSWIRRYKRHLRTRPRIWGLHNYHDANSLTSTGVRTLLHLVGGKIWLTETGGVVRIRVGKGRSLRKANYGIRHAARSTRHVLDLARISGRIQRIYLYNWNAPRPFTTWDSGLVDTRQRPRPAYKTLRSWLRHARRIRLAR